MISVSAALLSEELRRFRLDEYSLSESFDYDATVQRPLSSRIARVLVGSGWWAIRQCR
jgi:hypothetical protein